MTIIEGSTLLVAIGCVPAVDGMTQELGVEFEQRTGGIVVDTATHERQGRMPRATAPATSNSLTMVPVPSPRVTSCCP